MGRINDYTERTTLTGNEELVGVEGADTFKMTSDTLKAHAAPSSGEITKTLAPTGGDFSTFDEVFDWLDQTAFSNADVTINVSAGTYTSGATRNISLGGVRQLHINGASKATCIVTVTDAAGFILGSHAKIKVSNLTFNGAGTGATYCFQFYSGVDAWFEYCDFTGFYSCIDMDRGTLLTYFVNMTNGSTTNPYYVSLYNNSYGEFFGTVFDGESIAGSTGLNLAAGCSAYLRSNSTIRNCDTGINVGWRGVSKVHCQASMINNTEDFDIPANEVQPNGSYVSTDGLSFEPAAVQGAGIDQTQSTNFGNTFVNPLWIQLAPSGGDFSTMQELMEYLTTTKFDGVNLFIDVQPGTYTLQPVAAVGSAGWDMPGPAQGINSITFRGADKATCIFNCYGNRLFIMKGGMAFFENISFDHIPNWGSFMRVLNGVVRCLNINANNFYEFLEPWDSAIEMEDCTITATISGAAGFTAYGSTILRIEGGSCSVPNAYAGVSAYWGSSITLRYDPVTINNARYAFYADQGSRIVFKEQPVVTNATDYSNIPLNEIQYDGTYITNGQSAMSFKA